MDRRRMPVIMPERYAAVPKTQITEKSLVGNWEVIVMQYQYQTIQRSSRLVLSEDMKVAGSVTGTWSYDTSKNIITINGNKFNVVDAWDWEAFPRKATLTFSGFTSAGLPVWGKKIL